MKNLDWKSLGKFANVLLTLFTTVRDVFVAKGIGIEIIPFILGDGKTSFIAKLESVGEEYLSAQRWRLVDENTLLVNLEAPLVIPSPKARGNNTGVGWVKVEKNGDDLLVDGRKVILYQQEDTRCAAIAPHFRDKPVLHPNIMDALLEYQQFIPREWEVGTAPSVWFWAVTFSNESHPSFGTEGNHYLPRGMQYHDGKWNPKFMWRDFGVGGPAVMLKEEALAVDEAAIVQ